MTTYIINFSGPINPVTSERIRDTCLHALSQGASEIRLHISSEGGSTVHGFTLYHFLRSIPVPLVMHNTGNIDSIAVVVFLAGTTRLACPHSRFLIHPLQWGFNSGTVDHARLREYVSSLDNDLERYAQVFEERTKGTKEPLDIRTHLSDQEKVVTPAVSLASGITTGIAEAAILEGAISCWISSL